jgi:Flp pilus assembly pilin Flp
LTVCKEKGGIVVTVRLSTAAVVALITARDRLVKSMRREEGQAFVEYALVLVVIALVVATVTTWSPLRDAVGRAVTDVSNAIGP